MYNSNHKKVSIPPKNALLKRAVAENEDAFTESKIDEFAKKFLLETESIEAKLAEKV
jgi:hypothetical protein